MALVTSGKALCPEAPDVLEENTAGQLGASCILGTDCALEAEVHHELSDAAD